MTQCSYWDRIQSRFRSHCILVVIGVSRPSSSKSNGSGKWGIEGILSKSGGSSPTRSTQSSQVLSYALIRSPSFLLSMTLVNVGGTSSLISFRYWRLRAKTRSMSGCSCRPSDCVKAGAGARASPADASKKFLLEGNSGLPVEFIVPSLRPTLRIVWGGLFSGNSGFVVGERGFGPATALDTVDAPILKPSAFGRGWDLGACVNGGVEGRAGDAPLPPKWLITMGLRQKNRFNECKACGCEPASNHMSGFGFSATDSDSGRRAHGSHERARSARKGRKKHVSVLPRPNRSPWIVVEQNHNGIGKLMVPAFQIYANMNVINDL